MVLATVKVGNGALIWFVLNEPMRKDQIGFSHARRVKSEVTYNII